MDDVSLFALALPLVVVLAGAWFVVRPLLRLRTHPLAAPLSRPDRPGEHLVGVPVTRTFGLRRGFLWSVRSSSFTRPALTIAPEGLRFHILRDGSWPFAEIEQVDVREAIFGGGLHLLFLGDGNRRLLSAKVRDADTALAALAALPRDLPLSVAAATLRDGSPAAATPGLTRYRGAV